MTFTCVSMAACWPARVKKHTIPTVPSRRKNNPGPKGCSASTLLQLPGRKTSLDPAREPAAWTLRHPSRVRGTC